MKPLRRRWRILSLLSMALVLLFAASGPQSDSAQAVTGQSRTLLSDGRWLLLGGQDSRGVRSEAWLWDVDTQTATPVGRRSRAGLLRVPNPTVRIMGRCCLLLAELRRFSPQAIAVL